MIVLSFNCGVFDISSNGQVTPYPIQGTGSLVFDTDKFVFIWSSSDNSRSVEHLFQQQSIPVIEKVPVEGNVFQLKPVDRGQCFLYTSSPSEASALLSTFTYHVNAFVSTLQEERKFPALNSILSYHNLQDSTVLTDESLKELLPKEANSIVDTLTSPQWSTFLRQFEYWASLGLLEALAIEMGLEPNARNSVYSFLTSLINKYR
ncbi:hypothetical protein P9112_011553 [Eukaryota sp. TZLM1-RC]